MTQRRASGFDFGLQAPARPAVLSALAAGTRPERSRPASYWPVIAILGCALGASAGPASALSFEEARTALLAKSDKLKAAEANLSRQEFEVKAVETLGYPELILNATQVYGRKEFDLSALPVGINAYNYNFDGPRSSVLMTWPLFTGGKIGAAQKLREAEVTGAKAELLETEERLDFQLVARYFGLRLAATVEGLRLTQLEQADRQLARAQTLRSAGPDQRRRAAVGAGVARRGGARHGQGAARARVGRGRAGAHAAPDHARRGRARRCSSSPRRSIRSRTGCARPKPRTRRWH